MPHLQTGSSRLRKCCGLRSARRRIGQEAGQVALRLSEQRGIAKDLADAVVTYKRQDQDDEVGALKQFKMPGSPDEAAGPIQRFANEIQALQTVQNDPAALRLLEFDDRAYWMITEYHAAGSLSKYPWMFKSRVDDALRALRPIVVLAKWGGEVASLVPPPAQVEVTWTCDDDTDLDGMSNKKEQAVPACAGRRRGNGAQRAIAPPFILESIGQYLATMVRDDLSWLNAPPQVSVDPWSFGENRAPRRFMLPLNCNPTSCVCKRL